jgi:hypothetical protein
MIIKCDNAQAGLKQRQKATSVSKDPANQGQFDFLDEESKK